MTLVLSTTVLVATASTGSAAITYQTQWGGPLDGQFGLPPDGSPGGVATDSADNVYVADRGDNRIQKFTSAGAFVSAWGTYGSGPGELDGPIAVAVDSSDHVYVTDAGNHRVQKFTATGTFVATSGTLGTGNGQFNTPTGIATDTADNVYVFDDLNIRVEKFDSSGTFLTAWGSVGTGNGQFGANHRLVTGVAVDSSNHVYVADPGNSRVEKFDSSGTFVTAWGSYGGADGQMGEPQGIGVDSSDHVYVYDRYPGERVQKFDSSGAFLAKFGSFGIYSYGMGGVAVDTSDHVYVVDGANSLVVKYTSAGAFVTQWGAVDGSVTGQVVVPRGVAAVGADKVYVVDPAKTHVVQFDAAGSFVTSFGSVGYGDGQFQYPIGIAADPSGNVYVVDGNRGAGNNRIEKFTAAGVFVSSHLIGPTFPEGLAIDTTGRQFVADFANRVQRYGATGTYETQWGSSGTGDGQFNGVFGVATDSANDVYVVDRGNNRIQKFDPSGAFLAKWGSYGTGNGQFDGPNAIAIDASDNVFVSDTRNSRIQKFSSTGTFLDEVGTRGGDLGQFNLPSDNASGNGLSGGVAVNPSGQLFVADTGNHRVQRFSTLPIAPAAPTGVVGVPADGQVVVSWSTPASDGGSPIIGYTVTSTPDGRQCTTTGALTCTVTGLTNGTPYTFTVTASNAYATSAPSAPSAAVTPVAPAIVALTPARLLETRSGPGLGTIDGLFQGGGPRPAWTTLALTINGRAGIPLDASAVSLNVTVTAPTGPGYITVYPCGAPQPNASNLNYTAGQVIPNAVIAKIGTNHQICLFTNTTTDLIVDVNGSFP